MSSSYHPETDGQMEVLNHCVRLIFAVLLLINLNSGVAGYTGLNTGTIPHLTATKMTPFQVAYNRSPPTLVKFLVGETVLEAVAQELEKRDEILCQLKYSLERAQHRKKKQADLKREDYSFSVGDWVYNNHQAGNLPAGLEVELSTTAEPKSVLAYIET